MSSLDYQRRSPSRPRNGNPGLEFSQFLSTKNLKKWKDSPDNRYDPAMSFAVSQSTLDHPMKDPMHPNEYIQHHLPSAVYLARGAFGYTCKMEVNAETRRHLDTVFHSLANRVDRVNPSHIPNGTHIIIKVQAPQIHPRDHIDHKKYEWDRWRLSGEGEAQNHRFLMDRRPMILKCGGSVTPEDVVPQYYFGGADFGAGIYIIAMGNVEGQSLHRHMRMLTPTLAASAEKAVLILHCFGLAHGDLHTGNMMKVEGEERVMVIDLGMSQLLPMSLQNKAREIVHLALADLARGRWPTGTVDQLWYSKRGIGAFVDQRMARKGFDRYNPNGKLVRILQSSVHKKQGFSEDIFVKARQAVWGCTPGHVHHAPESPKSSTSIYKQTPHSPHTPRRLPVTSSSSLRARRPVLRQSPSPIKRVLAMLRLRRKSQVVG